MEEMVHLVKFLSNRLDRNSVNKHQNAYRKHFIEMKCYLQIGTFVIIYYGGQHVTFSSAIYNFFGDYSIYK